MEGLELMIKRIKNILLGENLDIKEQLFRITVMIGMALSIIGMVEEAFVTSTKWFFIPLTGLLIDILIAVLFTFVFKKYKIGAVILGVQMILVTFPMVFFFFGGVHGGAAIWFIMGYLYTFLIFEGKMLAFFTALNLLANFVSFYVAINYPQMISPLRGKRTAYLDSIFAVISVGVFIGSIFQFQTKLFRKEREITEKQKDELIKISSSKNAFFVNMSHEIRTPINTIIGLNEMILREQTSKEVLQNSIMIQNASKMLLSLVNDILDLSQIENSKMEIVPVEYSTKAMFEDLVDLIQVRTNEKKLAFSVHIDPEMPSVLFGDERRIKQVIINLLINAVKYTPEGSVSLIAKSEKIGEEWIRLTVSVQDTGTGIKSEDLEHLFDSFRRINNAQTRKIEGTGLGLAICKQFMNLMDGEIKVDSIYTKGSTFTISLEQKVIDRTEVGIVNFLARKYEQRQFYHHRFEAPEAKVLIVDDDGMNLLVASKLLKDTKMIIHTAKSGEECLQKTKEQFYNIILMDFMMPVMDGVETTKAIRNQENGLCKHSIVIALTANILQGGVARYNELGFDSFIEKPIVGDLLEEEIMRFLPTDLLEYREKEVEENTEYVETAQVMVGIHRKKVLISTDCTCDLPEELIKMLGIRIMYLYIRTENGRFADTKEIGSNNMAEYLNNIHSRAYSDSASVEEYESFFADALLEAEEVIHISLASNVGKSYSVACEAAKGFGHVRVVDSGSISAGLGLIVLKAAQMALDKMGSDEILKAIQESKPKVQTGFYVPSARIYHQRGYTSTFIAKLCEYFNLHLMLVSKKEKITIQKLIPGTEKRARRAFVHFCLHKYKKKANKRVVYITHVGLTSDVLEDIKKEVLKLIDFEDVRIVEASVSSSCNSGQGTFGIGFFTK